MLTTGTLHKKANSNLYRKVNLHPWAFRRSLPILIYAGCIFPWRFRQIRGSSVSRTNDLLCKIPWQKYHARPSTLLPRYTLLLPPPPPPPLPRRGHFRWRRLRRCPRSSQQSAMQNRRRKMRSNFSFSISSVIVIGGNNNGVKGLGFRISGKGEFFMRWNWRTRFRNYRLYGAFIELMII